MVDCYSKQQPTNNWASSCARRFWPDLKRDTFPVWPRLCLSWRSLQSLLYSHNRSSANISTKLNWLVFYLRPFLNCQWMSWRHNLVFLTVFTLKFGIVFDRSGSAIFSRGGSCVPVYRVFSILISFFFKKVSTIMKDWISKRLKMIFFLNSKYEVF